MKHTELTDWNIRTSKDQKRAECALLQEKIRLQEEKIILLAETGGFIGNDELFSNMMKSMRWDTNRFLQKSLELV